MNWTSPGTGYTLTNEEQEVANAYLLMMTPIYLFKHLFSSEEEIDWDASVDFVIDKFSDWTTARDRVRLLEARANGTYDAYNEAEEKLVDDYPDTDRVALITMTDYYWWHVGCWKVPSGSQEWEDWWNTKFDEECVALGVPPAIAREVILE